MKKCILKWKNSGYTVTLYHDNDVNGDDDSQAARQGWAIYLHQPRLENFLPHNLAVIKIMNIFFLNREEFTEYGISTSGRIENLFMEVHEEMELKMSVHHYIQVNLRFHIFKNFY